MKTNLFSRRYGSKISTNFPFPINIELNFLIIKKVIVLYFYLLYSLSQIEYPNDPIVISYRLFYTFLRLWISRYYLMRPKIFELDYILVDSIILDIY